jgi:hypothetical protein
MVYGRLVVDSETISEHLRFGYMFNDPNTAIYFFLIAMGSLLNATNSTLKLILLVLATAVAVFICQSRGALGAFVLMVIALITSRISAGQISYSPSRWFGLGVAIIILCGLFILLSDFLQENPMIDLAYTRLFENKGKSGYNTIGGRDSIWAAIVSKYYILPLGRGYQFGGFGPHSDVLRFIYSYGVVALLFCGWFLFGKLLSNPQLILPAIFAFVFNSLIDEQKLLALYLSLFAISFHSMSPLGIRNI